MIYLWLYNITGYNAAYEMGVTTKTVYDYYGYCREVCYVIVTNSYNVIGGEGQIVQIDESHIYTRKYHRGHFLRNERKQIWVFCGIQKDNNNCFITVVEKRDKDTLLTLIKKLILPETKIITDGWKAYNTLEQEGYIHGIVNHSIEFINNDDPEINTLSPRNHYCVP